MSLVPKPELRKLLTDAAKMYSEQIEDSEAHTMYLRSRGVTEDLQHSFGIGAVIDPVSNHEDYRGWISIPYFTPGGLCTIRFRRIDSEMQPKYMDLPGEVPRLFNTRALFRDDSVYLCEGEIDTMVAWSCGLAALGISGSTKWNPIFSRILKHRDVVVLQDGDEAGSKLATQVYKDLGGCKVVQMPKGEDVSSFVVEHGRDALLERIHND